MDDMKKPDDMGGDTAMKAKMEVVKALRKMAMELMASGLDGHDDKDQGPMGDGAVMAKLDVTKLPSDDEAGEDPAEEASESPDEEKAEDEPSDEDQASMIDKLLAKKKSKY